MTFDDKKLYVQGRRREAAAAGCKTCRKPSACLVLQGSPSLVELVRLGTSVADLDGAIEARGWFCRSCIAKQVREIQGEREKVAAKEDRAQAQEVREDGIRAECWEYMMNAADREDCQEFLNVVPPTEHVDGMVAMLMDGYTQDTEEAFVMVVVEKEIDDAARG